MIVPSIDLMDGSAVQLVEGREKAIDAGDPRPIADEFGLVGEVAVIDLDAALGRGSNEGVIRDLLERAPCRVGGGIRDVETAIKWLDAGARRVILGTAARPEILRELPRERIVAALDARDDRVLVEGWTRQTGARVEDRIDELGEFVGGFLVTFVEGEGRMGGLPAERVERIVDRAGPVRVTVAGGVRTPADIAASDRAGADAQVGMALYAGAFDLADGFCAALRSDRSDGLWPTVVADERGATLGLTYSSLASVREAIRRRAGVYFSRSRGALWIKGESSGDTQELLGIAADCDRDALRFTVRQRGAGFCHTGVHSCFGEAAGLTGLERTIRARIGGAPSGSYTARLLEDPDLLRAKLVEEAGELGAARDAEESAREAADLIYFALVAAARHGIGIAEIECVLDRRALRVTRRPGDAKVSTRHRAKEGNGAHGGES